MNATICIKSIRVNQNVTTPAGPGVVQGWTRYDDGTIDKIIVGINPRKVKLEPLYLENWYGGPFVNLLFYPDEVR